MGKGLFITATGTDIGKTYVTALMVKALVKAGLNASYYKAALSGAEETDGKLLPGDADYVAKTAGLKRNPSSLVSYIYKTAVSPHLASKIEGNPVDLNKIKTDFQQELSQYDYLTVEGSGGIICPIRWDEEKIMLEDIITSLGLGTVIVSNALLGSINACVLTAFYLQKKNIPVRGIILNNFDKNNLMQQDNKKMMEALSGVPVIGYAAPGAENLEIDLEVLQKLYHEPTTERI